MQTCLQESVLVAAENMTVAQLREECARVAQQQTPSDVLPIAVTDIVSESTKEETILERRRRVEAINRANRFLLTPHKRNYLNPITYTRAPNETPYQQADHRSLRELENHEAEFQFSIKILLRENIFGDNGHLYMGYTNRSLWQVYSEIDSAPFREVNHQPELLLTFNSDWTLFGVRNVINEFSLNHQSNGQGGELSRSWNRIIFNSVFEYGRFAFSLSPWYRLPESEKKFDNDPDGDDNPDIEDYMGHFEFNAAYKRRDDIFSLMLRNNLEGDNKGAMEMGWTFPISANLRGQLKYFKGYGYSLIDYNADQEVFSLGVVFTDIF